MNGVALSILRKVAKRYDVTLEEALAMAPKRHGDYRDQYPLAMLIVGEYLGGTMDHAPPQGAEKMREYSQATLLHDVSLKKKEDGSVAPAAIFFDGGKHHVFLKAKGALYLDEISKKRWDRFFSFFVGIMIGFCMIAFKWWIEK
jgi:hypothetical protein